MQEPAFATAGVLGVCRASPRGAVCGRSMRMTVASPPPPAVPSPAPAPAPAPTPAAAPADADADEPLGTIVGHEDFLAACARSVDRLVVVQVKAPWCRSCRALAPKVRRLAREFADDVLVYEMNYEDPANKAIAFRLGVKSMPTFLFYRGAAGQVEKFSCGPNRASMLREKIEQYVAGECAYAADDPES